MPQPLSSLPQVKHVNIGSPSDSPYIQRPELALLAMDVIAKWSILEGFIGYLFVSILGANPVPAAAIFNSIRSQGGQRDAFRAAVDANITDEAMQDLVFAVFGLYEGASALRNKIAHWTWGQSPDLPNAVLLAEPLMMTTHHARIAEHQENLLKTIHSGEGEQIDIRGPQLERRKIFAYYREDFQEASQKIERVIDYALIMANVFKSLSNPLVAERGLLQLRSAPEIDAELVRLNKRRQSES